jgi:CBS domain-containing protein
MSAHALPTFRFPEGSCIAQAQVKPATSVTSDSPAIEVMTDLTLVKAATITSKITLSQAEKVMIQNSVRLLFVSDDMPCLHGIVTSTDIQGPLALQLSRERQIPHNDLMVGDVMTPLAELDAIELNVLKRSTVSHVVATLRQFGRHHLLVVEDATPTSPARVRGIISEAQVQRQLGTDLHQTTIATTFAEIGRALQ